MVALTLVIGGGVGVGDRKGDRDRRRRPAVGPDEIVGMQGIARDGGLVYVHGELWQARPKSRSEPGSRSRSRPDGLVLRVHPV